MFYRKTTVISLFPNVESNIEPNIHTFKIDDLFENSILNINVKEQRRIYILLSKIWINRYKQETTSL